MHHLTTQPFVIRMFFNSRDVTYYETDGLRSMIRILEGKVDAHIDGISRTYEMEVICLARKFPHDTVNEYIDFKPLSHSNMGINFKDVNSVLQHVRHEEIAASIQSLRNHVDYLEEIISKKFELEAVLDVDVKNFGAEAYLVRMSTFLSFQFILN